MIEALLQEDYSQPLNFLKVSSIFFAIIFLRYLLFSAGFHYALHVVFKTRLSRRLINEQSLNWLQVRKEILWSGITSLIFGVASVLMIIAWQQGLTALYTDWDKYSLFYLPASLLLVLLVHDTYYYWLHRWMHRSKRIYRLVHKTHHDSIITNAMTSFSFHPIESILQAVFIPVLVLFLPMHVGVLIILLLIMTLSGTINHAGAELYGKATNRSIFWDWIIGARHHDIHHKKFTFNYGLYFSIWDRIMGTEYEED
jgi:lathosterol oxidase